jgi:lambda family phage minor tail protein L
MRIVGDAFKQAKNAELVRPIFLYSLLLDPTGNVWKRWTSWSDEIIFDGVTYLPFAITHSSISEDNSGKIQSVKITIANANREMQAILDEYDGLRERPITITQVWEQTILDPTAFIADTLAVKEVSVTEKSVSLTLSSELDVLNIKIPRKVMTRTFCRFTYKGVECGYAGSETRCNRTLNRCRELGNQARFGAFPATPLQKIFLRGA